jgi:hypothetical protein
MRRNHSTSDNEHPGRRTAPDTAATASSALGSDGLVHRRQLEKSVSWSGRERLRCLWYRLRLTIAEMNYASRRMVEVQARPGLGLGAGQARRGEQAASNGS